MPRLERPLQRVDAFGAPRQVRGVYSHAAGRKRIDDLPELLTDGPTPRLDVRGRDRLGSKSAGTAGKREVQGARGLAEACHGMDAFGRVSAVQNTARAGQCRRPDIAPIAFETLDQRHGRFTPFRVNIGGASGDRRRIAELAVLSQKPADLDLWIRPKLYASKQLQDQPIAKAD